MTSQCLKTDCQAYINEQCILDCGCINPRVLFNGAPTYLKNNEWSKFYLELLKRVRTSHYMFLYHNGFNKYIANGSSILKIGDGLNEIGFVLSDDTFKTAVVYNEGESYFLNLDKVSPEMLLFQVERIFYGAGEPL